MGGVRATNDDEAVDLLDPLPPKASVPYQVQVLARFFQVDFLRRIADTGLSPAQVYVLRELWDEEPLSQVELSRRLDIGKATVGQTLNRLERNRMVTRRAHSTDRRIIMVHLTARGRAVREPLATAACRQMEELTARFGKRELDDLTALLNQLMACFVND